MLYAFIGFIFAELKKLADTAEGVERLYNGTSKQRETVGKIMEKILVLQYPIGVETITLDQLLDWELWPCFIKIFSKIQYYVSIKSKYLTISANEPRRAKAGSCLTEHCTILSACANSILTSMCEKLANGEVVIKDLQTMLPKRAQMEKLCSVTSHWKGLKRQHPKDDLARRLHECENFVARKDLLQFLCSQVTVPVIGKFCTTVWLFNIEYLFQVLMSLEMSLTEILVLVPLTVYVFQVKEEVL